VTAKLSDLAVGTKFWHRDVLYVYYSQVSTDGGEWRGLFAPIALGLNGMEIAQGAFAIEIGLETIVEPEWVRREVGL